MIRLRRDGHSEQADALLESRFVPSAKQYMTRVEALMEMQRKALDESAAPIKAANDKARYWLIALGAITIGGHGAGRHHHAQHHLPLSDSVAVADTIAHGDLTTEVVSTRSDEAGQLLRALADMQHSLASVIGQIRSAGDQIASASDQIAGARKTCRRAPNTRPPTRSRQRRPWSSSPPPQQQSAEAARTASTLAALRLKWHRKVAASWPRWWRRWKTSTPARAALRTSSAPSMASPSRPISWR